jgi:SAM-dependent methyltransferase
VDFNINTKKYWDHRFASRDWELKHGRKQTRLFAEEQCRRLDLPVNFTGVITDFGCGLGDAIPVYKEFFPQAILRGYDISFEAIKRCKECYGDLAQFKQGAASDVVYSDVIVSSNVFEHLSDDLYVAKVLFNRCKYLYITVPYKEKIVPGTEHVNYYDEYSFVDLRKTYLIYYTKGYGSQGMKSLYDIYLKNILRPLFGKPLASRSKQIMFKFRN